MYFATRASKHTQVHKNKSTYKNKRSHTGTKQKVTHAQNKRLHTRTKKKKSIGSPAPGRISLGRRKGGRGSREAGSPENGRGLLGLGRRRRRRRQRRQRRPASPGGSSRAEQGLRGDEPPGRLPRELGSRGDASPGSSPREEGRRRDGLPGRLAREQGSRGDASPGSSPREQGRRRRGGAVSQEGWRGGEALCWNGAAWEDPPRPHGLPRSLLHCLLPLLFFFFPLKHQTSTRDNTVCMEL